MEESGRKEGKREAAQVQSVRKISGGREGGSYLPHCEDFLNFLSLQLTALDLLLLCHYDRNTFQKQLKTENSYLSPGFRGFQSFLVWKAGVSSLFSSLWQRLFTLQWTRNQEVKLEAARNNKPLILLPGSPSPKKALLPELSTISPNTAISWDQAHKTRVCSGHFRIKL